MKNVVKNETNVRTFVKQELRGAVVWVEPKRGATFGLPDALVVGRGLVAMLELKAGRLRSDGYIKFDYRLPQQACMERFTGNGLPCFYLVGVVGTADFYLAPPSLICGKGTFPPWAATLIRVGHLPLELRKLGAGVAVPTIKSRVVSGAK